MEALSPEQKLAAANMSYAFWLYKRQCKKDKDKDKDNIAQLVTKSEEELECKFAMHEARRHYVGEKEASMI